ncbi:hypothetical protein QYF36_003212 [Acer negundo]|nr:hypothetical protein QYF36_003212 [Acer negundo]
MDDLQSCKEDIEQELRDKIQHGCYLKCAERVEIRFGDVNDINNQVVGILERGHAEAQNKCFGGFCPRNCRSRYNLGKEIFLMIAAVQDLIQKWRDDTKNLEANPTGLILSLSSLEVFSRLLPTTANVLHYDQSLSDIALLQKLECFVNSSDISLMLSTFGSVLKFKASSKLQCCIKRLTIMCSELETLDKSSSTMKSMEHLDTLSIRDCHSLTQLKISFEEQGRMQGSKSDCFHNLRYLHIENCSIKDLTWLRYTTTLRYLWVDNCPLLEQIIADDFGSSEIEENMDILSKLEIINLVGLPSLKSICRRAVLFPCVQNVEIINCPSLRKLPFESGSAEKSLKAIKGSKTWWHQLEWDDAATKDAFASKFFDSDFVLFKPTVHSDYTKNLLRFKQGSRD